jgi:hypothetical protein
MAVDALGKGNAPRAGLTDGTGFRSFPKDCMHL